MKPSGDLNAHADFLPDRTWRDAHQGHLVFCDLSGLIVVASLREKQSRVAFIDKTVSHSCLSHWWILPAGAVNQWVSLRERQVQFCPVVAFIYLFIHYWHLNHWGDDHYFKESWRHDLPNLTCLKTSLHLSPWPGFSPQTLEFHRKHLVLQDSCEAFLGRHDTNRTCIRSDEQMEPWDHRRETSSHCDNSHE